jgi:hypothetical protein
MKCLTDYKVKLIIVYYGKLPNYFNFWLTSCQNNPEINWLVVTENEITGGPDNVEIINISFDKLKDKIEGIVNFDIELNTPYKLCDFRPAYGEIFSGYLRGYDFWGYCDIDLIFGKFRTFYIPDLDTYDRILVNGHLSIFRNNTSVNSYYRILSDEKCNYKKIFQSKLSWAFDEFGGKTKTGGINRLLDDNKIKQYKEIIFDDIRQNQFSFYSSRISEMVCVAKEKKQNQINSYYYYNNGDLFRYVHHGGTWHKSETLYVHFQKRIMEIDTNDVDEYIIIPNTFTSFDKVTNLLRSTSYKYIYPHYYNIRFNNLKNKIRNKLLNIK